MEEKTMEITKLKIELNAQKHLKQIRFKTFENIRELRAKLEYDDLIKEFDEQCNIVDEQQIDEQLDQNAKEEQAHYAQVYEKSMLANLDNINFDEVPTLEEEYVS
ncbi:unnamed protein product (macronuclear) [Paramecium tetraurelia]|uniref:Tubulin-specific chaperone A n=2 Tax=Paramecium TaxID=5884 RepID=A0DGW8_PARTE|nr:uncharacterized protein GSPATT00002414001 [Paramecium tetraurelia]CAD8140799.1 unnamed protein product [Paramecium octaurelia]CAK82285.1 unnamed protein product [Paramecium tetraurelia]|eukprot:XP_001449682.1 hypothetical protein (macronuclear) [Paramecium tetraurelia strain d4-2]